MSWFGPVATLGECPRWDEATQTLTWVDIDGGTLHRGRRVADAWDEESWTVGVPLAGGVAVEGDPNAYVVSLGGDLVDWHPDRGLGGRVAVLPPESGASARLNETVTDPQGRVWVGSMAYDWTPGAGAFYVHDDTGVREVLSGFTITNGVGWSPDGATMYTTETGPGSIISWRVGPDGNPIDPRVVISVDGGDGAPDGLAVDTDGNLWSAFAGGGHVACISPLGRMLHRVEVGVPLTTSCCFAGPSRDRLVVTTGTKRMSPDELARHPEAGRVLDAGPVGAVGLPQVATRSTAVRLE